MLSEEPLQALSAETAVKRLHTCSRVRGGPSGSSGSCGVSSCAAAAPLCTAAVCRSVVRMQLVRSSSLMLPACGVSLQSSHTCSRVSGGPSGSSGSCGMPPFCAAVDDVAEAADLPLPLLLKGYFGPSSASQGAGLRPDVEACGCSAGASKPAHSSIWHGSWRWVKSSAAACGRQCLRHELMLCVQGVSGSWSASQGAGLRPDVDACCCSAGAQKPAHMRSRHDTLLLLELLASANGRRCSRHRLSSGCSAGVVAPGPHPGVLACGLKCCAYGKRCLRPMLSCCCSASDVAFALPPRVLACSLTCWLLLLSWRSEACKAPHSSITYAEDSALPATTAKL